jgi:glycosyltransferase involved in cell wall biosynthesis
MTVPVSIIVHARNEATNIPFTLSSVAGWADEVFVVDSESTDGTADVARSHGATVVSRQCERQGLVAQRNWALDTLPFRNEWVFVLDADEYMEDALKVEVERLVRADDPGRDGYWLRFRLIFMGQWIRRASMYPTWSLRLLRHRVVRYEVRSVNSHPRVAAGREGFLDGHVVNYDRKGFTYYMKRIDEFSTLEAIAYEEVLSGSTDRTQVPGKLFGTRAERRRWLKNLFIRLPMRPLVIFLYLYVARGGFLEGQAGFDYCFLKALQEWVVNVKRREVELRRNGRDQWLSHVRTDGIAAAAHQPASNSLPSGG